MKRAAVNPMANKRTRNVAHDDALRPAGFHTARVFDNMPTSLARNGLHTALFDKAGTLRTDNFFLTRHHAPQSQWEEAFSIAQQELGADRVNLDNALYRAIADQMLTNQVPGFAEAVIAAAQAHGWKVPRGAVLGSA